MMRRAQRTSSLPSDPAGRGDVIGSPSSGPAPAAGISPHPASNGARSERSASAHWLMAAQFGAAVAAMTGLWVAISPWFLDLQLSPGGNARADDLIVGLVVAVLGLLAMMRLRGRPGIPAAGLLAGIWVLISPFILAAKFPVTDSMYWSNIWAGAVIIVTSAGVLAAVLARGGRDMA